MIYLEYHQNASPCGVMNLGHDHQWLAGVMKCSRAHNVFLMRARDIIYDVVLPPDQLESSILV